MNRTDPTRSSRRIAIFFVAVAIMWLIVAVWSVTIGNTLEAVGHVLIAALAVVAAVMVSNPRRPPRSQRRLMIGGLSLVPIILGILIVSLFV